MYKVTSAFAAAAIEAYAPTQREKILDAIKRDPLGATRDQLQHGLKMPGDTVRPRVLELIKAGKIHETMEKRKTRQGRQAFVLKACPHA
jgi:hypothetical protein